MILSRFVIDKRNVEVYHMHVTYSDNN